MWLLLPLAFAFVTESHLAADVVAPSSASGVPFALLSSRRSWT